MAAVSKLLSLLNMVTTIFIGAIQSIEVEKSIRALAVLLETGRNALLEYATLGTS